MSFREGLQWITLIGVGLVYGGYFSRVMKPVEIDVTAGQIALFAWYTALLVAIHVVGTIVLVGFGRMREDEEDERDRMIATRSRSVASYVLAIGIFASMYTAFLMPGNFGVLHSLLATLVIAQMVESAMQIIAYRRGF